MDFRLSLYMYNIYLILVFYIMALWHIYFGQNEAIWIKNIKSVQDKLERENSYWCWARENNWIFIQVYTSTKSFIAFFSSSQIWGDSYLF